MMNAILDPSSWSVRKTKDGRVSVVDVVAAVTGKSSHYAAKAYRRLVAEERVPQCAVSPCPQELTLWQGLEVPAMQRAEAVPD